MFDAIVGDNLRREAWKAQLRKDESSQDRKCQQVSSLLAHQGKTMVQSSLLGGQKRGVISAQLHPYFLNQN